MNDNLHNPHGGDASAVAQKLGLDDVPGILHDFSVNINPLGPPPCIHHILSRSHQEIQKYPEVSALSASSALASAHGVPAGTVTVGNGSTEIMSWLLQALKPENPAWIAPCYAGYEEICISANITGHNIDAVDNNFSIDLDAVRNSDADLVFMASPNNPTGTMLDTDALSKLAADTPDRWYVVDESFMDFVQDSARSTLISTASPRNIIVVKSLTKFFAIPGLRLGMAYAHPDIIELVNKVRLPWSVNCFAQLAAAELYSDSAYVKESRKVVCELRGKLMDMVKALPGYIPLASHANFILVRLPGEETASTLQARLIKQGILVRSCSNFDKLGESYIRLAVRSLEEAQHLISAIRNQDTCAPVPGTPAIMVVGTMSDSGKSVVATGLCRYLQRRGRRVAPFKAQNMALNSYVTPEGGEMGRAQVVQAEAAGIQPHTDMNPVLLKPMGDAGSQVIVNGKAIGNFPAADYYKMKNEMKQAARAAYDRLSSRYDIIVMEGAGSPAEINLMAEDFVNMAMAEYAKAKVILVADIDRGGVFASIFGTVNLLPWNYRRLIKGIIINKFRGDISLLNPGIKQIETITGIPVLGVLPYIRDLNIEDEDSLGLDKRRIESNPILDIVVIRLPRISNYTDFLALENTEQVSVRYVTQTSALGSPDLVIIPGTKNTRADLQFLYREGWSDTLMDLTAKKIPVFGICGGYQMLGSRVSDPNGVEGKPGDDIGLNLLPLITILEPQKELAQVQGFVEQPLPFAKPQTPVSGYEIHAGRTTTSVPVNQPLLITQRLSRTTSELAGAVSDDGLVFGCYIHGIFDSPEFRNQLLNWLCANKNISPPEWKRCGSHNDSYDRLAGLIESNINLAMLGDI